MSEKLSGMEEKVFRALAAYINEHGYSPTIRELALTTEMSPANVWNRLVQLATKGWVVTTPLRSSRNLQLVRSIDDLENHDAP